ncbi:zinc ribbon domain-containing protein [Niallia taxi]|uniref:zinc ribbon domain-containing protein n=1 Tax=Niallia taxi TaxID=2499688 RepID=UPI0021A5FB66|nr:zinc ribbon domain-containing protein [Niallia taxi]MCT2346597.1 zinc ribbon domain-containing protein [Niallia taxi]MED3964030.1 zinc ribbon domain-containing protein [Niallia taxi]
MNCVKCGHRNDNDARFCESCGANLQAEIESNPNPILHKEEATAAHVSSSNPNQPGNSQAYIEKTKAVSKQYFSYFLSALKNPVKRAGNTGKENLINGIITIVLFALIIPLMSYFALKSAFNSYGGGWFTPDISFGAVVIKPLFVLLILLALVALIIFGAVKLSKSSASFLDVLARFGAFLVVPTAFLLVALIISLIGSYYFVFFLLLGLTGFSFVIPLIIYSYSKQSNGGLDAFYGILLSYIAITIVFMIIGDAALDNIEEMFEYMNPFNF